MTIVCPGCQARYKFDETKLGDRPRAKTKCAKCGGTIEIENPLVCAMTLPPGTPVPEPPAPAPPPPSAPDVDRTTKKTAVMQQPAPPSGEGTLTGRNLHKAGVLELPRDKRYSLAVIAGAAAGEIFPITKVRTTLGRAGSDITLDDAEASRQHAALEVLGEHAILRDLGSTNGTYVDMDRVEQHVLTNQMEFRIGSHVLMLIVTDLE
jgi:predicted Zn finger-like uncharacterized protein